MKTIFWLIFFTIFSMGRVFAICVQEGGTEKCVQPKLSQWNISSYPAGLHGHNVWCNVRGGTVNHHGTCLNATQVTELNLVQFNRNFFDNYGAPQGYSLQDTGWTLAESPANYQKYQIQNGVEVSKHRRFDVYSNGSWANVNHFSNNREFICQPNMWRILKNGDLLCAESVKKVSSCGVGNPCSITTGNKYQKEQDWKSNQSILEFYRFYNSLNEAQENKNEFVINEERNLKLQNIGESWTHNYNGKLMFWRYTDTDQPELIKPSSISSLSPEQVRYITGTIYRNNGQELFVYVQSVSGNSQQIQFKILDDPNLKIKIEDGLWKLLDLKNQKVEYYNSLGRLVKIVYSNGQFIALNYADVPLNSTTLLLGRLTKATDNFGRSLQFSYNTQGLISSVTLPNNKQIIYQYDTQNRLVSVTRPSYGTKNYHYSENSTVAPSGNPNLLTGITDEVGKRYANYAYDSADRGILTEHAGGAQKYTLQHSDNTTSVTDPSGTSWLYNKILASGTPRISSSIRANVPQSQNSYDQAGNITQKVEKGLTTNYIYDLSRNLEISRTEAVGTAQERKTETSWHADFPKPTEIKESAGTQVLRITTYTYDNNSNALTKTITDPQTQEARTWSYEYNNFGQLTKETNPQGQISSYQYDENNGNLLKTISADGITTTYSQHNADGQPQHIESSNGQSIDLVYDDAGRIIQQKQSIQHNTLSSDGHELSWWQIIVNAVYDTFGADEPYVVDNQTPSISNITNIQTAITSYEYDPRGLLVSTTLPDGEKIEYSYDDAHRLNQIKDQSGNRTVYTLNANGDITQTEVYGASGQLEAKTQQVYDNLGRLQQSVGNHQQLQTTSYNNYDQVQSDKNALNQSYSYAYDALGRQISETDPLNGINKTEYDAFDQIKKVIDAKNGTTAYQYNAFGEKVAQNSPDTGTTAYQYQHGQLLEKTDALQLKHQYEYDAQGRVILQKDQKNDGSNNYEHTQFAYGQTGDDLGKLTTAKNKRSETHLSYNNLGLVAEKSVKYLSTNQSTPPQLKLNYSYTLGGKLKQLALPSGNIVNYDYNATGQLSGIRLNDQSFIGNIQYSANGIKGWTYSTVGDSVQYLYDLDGRIQRINMPNVYDKNYSFDSADQILSILDPQQPTQNSNFKHDALSRLIEQNTANKTFKYSYDKNSNRLTRQTIQGTTTNTENYNIATNSNRLNNIQQGTSNKPYSYLATGQITSDGTRNYTYDAQGRSETISRTPNTILNAYDAFGQRIQKFSNIAGTASQVLFIYDENGQLLGEYTSDGKVIREYIWLDGTLVGLRSHQYPNEILRVHTDHLGTPRAISNNSNQVVWRWEGDQFGDVLPTGNLTFPIRHAGQYYDQEVNIFYNYFRDYDPITGRYVESDPIGLDGGLNTYGYVGGNSLHSTDALGLFPNSAQMACARNPALCAEIGMNIPKPRPIVPPISASDGWTPSDEAPTHPSKIEQGDALECPNTTDECAYLTWSIDVLVRQMKYYRWDAQRYAKQGYTGGYNDHKKFHNSTLKPKLTVLVMRARVLGCPYNPEADQEITRNFDFHTPNY